jgi:hypothetical protein
VGDETPLGGNPGGESRADLKLSSSAALFSLYFVSLFGFSLRVGSNTKPETETNMRTLFRDLAPKTINASALAGAAIKVSIEAMGGYFTANFVSHGPAVIIGKRQVDGFAIFSGERRLSQKPTLEQVKSSIESACGVVLGSVEIV